MSYLIGILLGISFLLSVVFAIMTIVEVLKYMCGDSSVKRLVAMTLIFVLFLGTTYFIIDRNKAEREYPCYITED